MADDSVSSPFFDVYPQFDSFVQEVFGRLIEGTKIANTFPAEDDHAYYKTSFKPFNSKVKELGLRLLKLTQRFVDLENPNTSLRLTELASDPEEVSENFDGITSIVDSLVEKVVRGSSLFIVSIHLGTTARVFILFFSSFRALLPVFPQLSHIFAFFQCLYWETNWSRRAGYFCWWGKRKTRRCQDSSEDRLSHDICTCIFCY